MERLTHSRSSGIKTGYWSSEVKETLVQRLAQYENTGLTPDEIREMRSREKTSKESMMEKIRITITENENGLQIQAEGCVDEMDVLKRMVVSAAKIIADMIREDLSAEERKKAAEGMGNILAEEVTEILLAMLEREKMK